ncbi:DUF6328 family protein (plasmid) [Streptomyces sp. JL4002]|uniref:DUF6328 family protein n=1 Tax=Streptomyces sp. JL4002 TaxID=3404781 RepID=UPI003B283D41
METGDTMNKGSYVHLESTVPNPQCCCNRTENSRDKVNRRWNEILQETRVALTGVQILFGFLLGLAFTPLFGSLEKFNIVLYVLTVAMGASSTAAFIAPVAIHRILSGLRLKDQVVETAALFIGVGMFLLAATIGLAIFLVLNVALRSVLSVAVSGAVMGWFALCWLLVPMRIKRRTGRNI